MIFENFYRCTGQTFSVELGATALDLTLAEARPLPVQPIPGVTRQPFVLLFRSGSAVLLPQNIYRMSNLTMGKMEIFIVPVGRDGAGILYEAVFN